MSERHYHKFVPIGGFEQRGTERMQQFCECGAQRCIGEAAHGFGSSSRRCKLAAVAGERYCKRHKERPRGPDWVEAATPQQLVDKAFVEAVESEIGMGCGAWDMVDAKGICAAVLKVAASRAEELKTNVQP